MYEVHYWPTPNGKKVTILLEELGVPYEIRPVEIGKGDQFKDEFFKMNPNTRMPVLADTAPADGEGPLSVFESGAILMYLAEKEGRFFPQAPRAKADVTQWVMWQMANQGPKFGECGHFRRLGDRQGDQSYALRRFGDEVNRLFGVMNNRLAHNAFLAAGEYTIADMAAYPWAANWESYGEDADLEGEFKHVKRWLDQIAARPAVQKGMAVGKDLSTDYSKLSEEEISAITKMLFNQRAIPVKD